MNLINHLNLNEVVDTLWGGTAKNFKHDMLQHSITFVVEVNENDVMSFYDIKFERVSKLKITYDLPEKNWNYVELTEIEIEKVQNKLLFSSELWSSGLLEIEAEIMKAIKTEK